MKAALFFVVAFLVTVNGNDYMPRCKEGETISPLTGQCGILPTFYVNNYPEDCPMDVGCLPISQKPAS